MLKRKNDTEYNHLNNKKMKFTTNKSNYIKISINNSLFNQYSLNELNEYLNDPSKDKKEDINKKLRLLIKEMCLMPEYYLS